jgi:TolA-binding protein
VRREIGWLWLALVLGCGPAHGEAFELSFAAGQRAYSAGRYEEAAQLFDRAAADAERVKDRDEALFLRARMYERLQRWSEAREAYRRLLATSPDGPRAARAAFEIATIEIDHGEAEAGWKALAAAVERYPSHGSASRAIELWAERTAETQGEEALRAALERWRRDLGASASAQRIKYEIARSHARGGDHAAARDAYLRAAREHPYPKGNLTDDAYWFAAEEAEAASDPRGAIAILEELLSFREISGWGQSYERPRYPAAQLRVAELHLALGELERALAAFRRTHENHVTSVLADDAMWQEAILSRRLGDAARACAVLEALKKREPPSRFARCAGLLCPAAGAASRCPRYIAESIDPTALP